MKRLMIIVLALVVVVFAVVLTETRVTAAIAVAPTHGVTGGEPQQGRQMLVKYGCGSCHTVRGLATATGRVGPVLNGLREQGYIAGKLPNTPENLIRWIQHPQEVDPGNAMPDLGVSERDARDIASYLYSVERGQ